MTSIFFSLFEYICRMDQTQHCAKILAGTQKQCLKAKLFYFPLLCVCVVGQLSPVLAFILVPPFDCVLYYYCCVCLLHHQHQHFQCCKGDLVCSQAWNPEVTRRHWRQTAGIVKYLSVLDFNVFWREIFIFLCFLVTAKHKDILYSLHLGLHFYHSMASVFYRYIKLYSNC